MKLVLYALADRYNADQEICWPSVQWICDFTELGERTVRRALDDLEAAGLIVFVGRRGNRADRMTNAYTLPVDNHRSTTGQSGTPRANGVPETTKRGAREYQTGCQSGTLTNREPLENRARNKRNPVENRAPVRSPEETLAFLEQERANQ